MTDEKTLTDALDALRAERAQQRAIDEQTLRVAGEQLEAMRRERDEARVERAKWETLARAHQSDRAEALMQRDGARAECAHFVSMFDMTDKMRLTVEAERDLLAAQLAEATTARGEALAALGAMRDVLTAYDAKLTEVWGDCIGPHAYVRGWVEPQWVAALENPTEAGKSLVERIRADERAKHVCGVAWPDLVKHDARVRAVTLEEASDYAEDWTCPACGTDSCRAMAAEIRALSPPAPSPAGADKAFVARLLDDAAERARARIESPDCEDMSLDIIGDRAAEAVRAVDDDDDASPPAPSEPDCAPSAKPSGGDR